MRKRAMKRVACAIGSIFLGLTLMAGSMANVFADDSGKETIEFWMLPLMDESVLQGMVDEFNAQSDTTQVNLTVLAWTDGREQIKQAVAAGAGPDVFYLSSGLDASLVEAGMLLPLDENGYTEDDIAKYTDKISGSMVDGHLYNSPLIYETYIMFYRTDILAEYGFDELPSSWEEVKEMAATITQESDGKIMGFQFKGADDQLNAINYSWQNVLADFGGSLMDMDNMASSENSEEGIAALEFMKSFYAEGISAFGTSANTAFREGVLAMYCFTNGPLSSEGFIGDPDLEGKWTVGPMPGPSAYLGGHGLSASAATEKAENCVEFMKWFSGPVNVATWMESRFSAQPFDTSKLNADEAESIQAVCDMYPEIWDAINASTDKGSVEMYEQGRYGYTARWDAQKRLIIAALNGEIEVEDALSQIDSEVDQSL